MIFKPLQKWNMADRKQQKQPGLLQVVTQPWK